MKKEQGIYYKFNVLIVGSIFLCCLLIGGMMLRMVMSTLETSLISTGREIGTYLAAAVSNDILVDNQFSIHERMSKTMEANKQIRYIMVTHSDGSLMASTFTDGLPVGLPVHRVPDGKDDIDLMSFSSNEGTIKEIMVPIDDGYIGYIRLGLTEKYMLSSLQERFLVVVLMVILVCAVAATLATRYAHEFLRPVARLSFAVKQMDKGNYGIQVPVDSKDEIGRLASTFNKMSTGLRSVVDKNNRLLEDLQLKEQNRRWLIEQLFTAREDEQRRISRELHDESSQSMASILTYLRVLHDRLTTDEQREMLFEIRELTSTTLEGIRRLAVDLHPPLLEDLGLRAAIEKYLEPICRMHRDIDFSWQFQGDFNRLSKPVNLMCYRTVQESVANVLKYAEATKVDIFLRIGKENVILTVADNGIGFDRETAEKARLNRHLGLVSMRERIELLQGTFLLETAPGKGTKITMLLPIDEGNDFDNV